jgi:hypothetical protein
MGRGLAGQPIRVYQEYRKAQTQDVVVKVARLGCARGLAGSGAHFG